MPSDGVPAASASSSVATSSGSEDGGHRGDGRIERDISTAYGTTSPNQDEYGHTDSEQSEDYDSDSDSDEYSSGGEYTDGSYDSDEYYTESEEEEDDQAQRGKATGGWWPFGRSGGSAAQPPAKDEAEGGASVEGSDDEESAANNEEGDEQPERPDANAEQNDPDVQGDKSVVTRPPDEQAETNDESKAATSQEDALPLGEGQGSAEDDGESYASEEGSEETGSSGEYESESADESVESYDDEEEDGQPSLHERRSLLSLAAEHDRVDIINTLLSGGDAPSGAGDQRQVDPALVDLLLNNSPKHDDIFIPPLHVAIASGSTRAVAALLRLGSDPSIRPEVPRGYIPPWVEGGGDVVRTPNTRSSWRKFDGMSAWELAYGREATEEDGEDSDIDEDEPAVPARRSYFFGRFGSAAAKEKDSAADSNTTNAEGARKTIRKRSPLNIAPSKLEGIRHAFTAEALRAIGSDEVGRLAQLVNAGMDKGVEAGGKNLLGWAQEMDALGCVKMLTERWGADDDVTDTKNISTDKSEEESTSPPESTVPPTASSGVPSSRVPPPPAPQSVGAFRRALEQNESLTPALSAMLDNLAEECSISQGLLLSKAGSKSSLVNNVRSLKANKAEREDELVFWSGKLEDREWELDDRLRRIAMLGGAEERTRVWKAVEERVHIKEIGARKISQQNLAEGEAADNGDSEGDAHLKAVLRTELAASNTKLSQLRASIADLAEENDRNLAEVQRRGLAGAVKLARKLRDELRLVEDDLREVRSAEAGLRVRVGLVTAELERLEAAKESESKANTETAAEAQSKMQASASGATSPAPHESIANEDDVLISDDEEFQKYVAQQDTVDPPGADVTDYHQGSDESDEDGVLVDRPSPLSASYGNTRELPSESIKAGHSTELVVGSNGFLSAGLWAILKRIAGFGRVAVQESVDEVVDEYRQSFADVMIV